MSKGPQKSPELKLLLGTTDSKKVKKSAPKARPGLPAPLPGLTATQKKHFNGLANQLFDMGVLTEADGESLSIVVQLYDSLKFASREAKYWKKAYKEVSRWGDTDEVRDALRVLMNWKKEETQLTSQLRAWSKEFGLSPRGRMGLVVTSKPEQGSELLT